MHILLIAVSGASLQHYLLEKSRVSHQNVGEHNFHVFGQLIAGLSTELRSMYRLEEYSMYEYLPEWVAGDGFFEDEGNLATLADEWQKQQQAMYQVRPSVWR